MSCSFENKKITANITINDLFKIEKMEDNYLSVRFKYQKVVWNGATPVVGITR